MCLEDNRFPKDNRLLNAKSYEAVFSQSNFRRKTSHGLLLAKRTGKKPRLGMVIGKKNVSLAVTRNSLKRQIRENFRLQKQSLWGWDIVFVAYRSILDLSKENLQLFLFHGWEAIIECQEKS